MSKHVHRVVVEKLARSLALRGAHAEIYDALHAAMPVHAERHLNFFHGDRHNAGEFLMFDIAAKGYRTLLDHYLSGDALGAYAQTSLVFKRVSGAMQNVHRMQAQSQSSGLLQSRSEDESQ